TPLWIAKVRKAWCLQSAKAIGRSSGTLTPRFNGGKTSAHNEILMLEDCKRRGLLTPEGRLPPKPKGRRAGDGAAGMIERPKGKRTTTAARARGELDENRAGMTRRKRTSVEEMRWHIRQLCKDGGIQRRWCRDIRQAHVIYGRPHTICLPPIRGVVEYGVALHEFGHIYGRYQHPRRYGEACHEYWAWMWARENALAWTEMMYRTAWRGMATRASPVLRDKILRALNQRR